MSMNSTHVRTSVGAPAQPQPLLISDNPSSLESFLMSKSNFDEKRVNRDIDSFWTSAPSRYSDYVTRDKKLHQHYASNRAFYSVVLVLTVVEPYEDQVEYYQSICTGTFISANVVLTLASCVRARDWHKVEPTPRYTKIYTRDGLILSSFKIYIYQDEQPDRKYASIMVERAYRTRFPKLPETRMDFAQMKNTCVLAGFGNQNRLAMRNFRARPLKEVKVREAKCKKGDRLLCLRFEQLQACLGDQGSPLICDGVLYAIYAPERFRPPHRCISRASTAFLPVLPARAWLASVADSPHPLAWFGNRWYVLITCFGVLVVISAIYYALAICVIKPFDRRLDHQLSEHVLSLESRSSLRRGSSGRWLGELADGVASAERGPPSRSAVGQALVASGKSTPVGRRKESVQVPEKRRKNS